MVGVVEYLDVAVAIVLRSRSAQRTGKEYLLKDEVFVCRREECLYPECLRRSRESDVFSLAGEVAFRRGNLRSVAVVVGDIG